MMLLCAGSGGCPGTAPDVLIVLPTAAALACSRTLEGLSTPPFPQLLTGTCQGPSWKISLVKVQGTPMMLM